MSPLPSTAPLTRSAACASCACRKCACAQLARPAGGTHRSTSPHASSARSTALVSSGAKPNAVTHALPSASGRTRGAASPCAPDAMAATSTSRSAAACGVATAVG
eukprot:CAMPEP_0119173098 /NCGR_PEP_ID=MMETSP1315-20130426/31674_1 /TAXON_ID=676789 /ORGANISM="Prasinoderma singularis, Strain RCC927" /LENGTH=104 /DNA_ID=CAMNT_0007167021 /DNA_START=46 /DNA_END=357 /DNA_ORIENTATION=+